MHDQKTRHRAVIHYTHFLRSMRKVAKIYDVGKSTLSGWIRDSGVPKERKIRTSLAKRIAPVVSGYLKKDPFMTFHSSPSLIDHSATPRQGLMTQDLIKTIGNICREHLNPGDDFRSTLVSRRRSTAEYGHITANQSCCQFRALLR